MSLLPIGTQRSASIANVIETLSKYGRIWELVSIVIVASGQDFTGLACYTLCRVPMAGNTLWRRGCDGADLLFMMSHPPRNGTYREISLLLRRTAGTMKLNPGDYLLSRFAALLEGLLTFQTPWRGSLTALANHRNQHR